MSFLKIQMQLCDCLEKASNKTALDAESTDPMSTGSGLVSWCDLDRLLSSHWLWDGHLGGTDAASTEVRISKAIQSSPQHSKVFSRSACAAALSLWPCVTSGDGAHYCILNLSLDLRLGFVSATLPLKNWSTFYGQVSFCPIRQAFWAEGRKVFCSP